MESIVMGELHDAKLKLVHAINEQDHEMIKKYEQVIKELEESLRLLQQQSFNIPIINSTIYIQALLNGLSDEKTPLGG